MEIYVTGAPLAALEAQLFDTRAENCLMLKTWLGFEAAFASQDFRKRLGRELRSIGPSAIDEMLHSSYCLSRTGPAGVFELRPAVSAEKWIVLVLVWRWAVKLLQMLVFGLQRRGIS